MVSTRTKSVVAALGVLALVGYLGLDSAFRGGKLRALEREKAELQEYVRRLSASRRVAQAAVTEQVLDARGVLTTRLLWQEIAVDGLIGPQIELEVVGASVYFEAFVLKFEHEAVARGESDRSTSLALFRRVFGDGQAPESGPSVASARLPTGTTEADLRTEQRLWRLFSSFVDAPDLARTYGVRVAQCEAPSVAVRPGQVWEVTLDAAGGLNLRKVHEAAAVDKTR